MAMIKCAHKNCIKQIDDRNASGMCRAHYRKPRETKKSRYDLEVKGSVRILHSSNSGIDMVQIDKGPVNYAAQLARYIRDPSTIRARTINEWGRAPSLDAIKGFIADSQAQRDIFRAEVEGLGESDEDEVDFVVRPLAEVTRRQQADNERRNNVLHFTAPVFTDPAKPLECFKPSEIIAGVATLMKCAPDDITGTSQYNLHVRARTIVCHLLRQRGLSYPAIGRRINRDHTTVMTAVRRFEAKADDRMRDIASRFLPAVAESEAA